MSSEIKNYQKAMDNAYTGIEDTTAWLEDALIYCHNVKESKEIQSIIEELAEIQSIIRDMTP